MLMHSDIHGAVTAARRRAGLDRGKMTLRVAASSDANALAIRDHLLPIVRAHGLLADFEGKDSPLRLFVLVQKPSLVL
jgi:hypothetical protein